METVLHNYRCSSASQRVRIVVNLKGIPFTNATVFLLEGKHAD